MEARGKFQISIDILMTATIFGYQQCQTIRLPVRPPSRTLNPLIYPARLEARNRRPQASTSSDEDIFQQGSCDHLVVPVNRLLLFSALSRMKASSRQSRRPGSIIVHVCEGPSSVASVLTSLRLRRGWCGNQSFDRRFTEVEYVMIRLIIFFHRSTTSLNRILIAEQMVGEGARKSSSDGRQCGPPGRPPVLL